MLILHVSKMRGSRKPGCGLAGGWVLEFTPPLDELDSSSVETKRIHVCDNSCTSTADHTC